MTPEELLRPRIKCVIRYPDSPFPVGAILEQDFEEPEIYNYTDSNRRPWMLENPGLYPEVFQPMQWWEDRKVEDYPAFLKTKNGEVRKINQIVTEESDDPFYTTEEDELGWYFHQDGVIPATEQEYLEYIKQKEEQR